MLAVYSLPFYFFSYSRHGVCSGDILINDDKIDVVSKLGPPHKSLSSSTLSEFPLQGPTQPASLGHAQTSIERSEI